MSAVFTRWENTDLHASHIGEIFRLAFEEIRPLSLDIIAARPL